MSEEFLALVIFVLLRLYDWWLVIQSLQISVYNNVKLLGENPKRELWVKVFCKLDNVRHGLLVWEDLSITSHVR